MMDKRIAYAMGLIIVVAIIVAALSNAQTAPTWIGTDITTGTTDVLTDGTTPAVQPLSSIQVIETTDWIGTFWGRNYNGGLVRICPMYGAGTDTTITPPVGAYLRFPGPALEEIRTVSGTATFWGE